MRKCSITIFCFDKHFWGVCANPFKMRVNVPCQESLRFCWLYTCVWLPTASTAFRGCCIWSQLTDWKDWCWGRHHLKSNRKSFWPLSLLSAKGLQDCDRWVVIDRHNSRVHIELTRKIKYQISQCVSGLCSTNPAIWLVSRVDGILPSGPLTARCIQSVACLVA